MRHRRVHPHRRTLSYMQALRDNAGAAPAAMAEPKKRTTGAHVLVQNLLAQGVRRVFCIPGAKM
jgi:hypothetical protein